MTTEQTDPAAEWVPEFPGQRPPFMPGHTLSLKHGATSPRMVDPIAAELTAGLLERRPDLAAYPEAVDGWAHAEAQARLCREYIAEHGPLDAKGKPRPVTTLQRHAESRAMKARAVLGLDPTAEAKLARDRAAAAVLHNDLAGLAAQGRAVLEQQQRLALQSGPDSPDDPTQDGDEA